MEKLQKIRIGKKSGFSSLILLMTFTCLSSYLKAQSNINGLENKAVKYFCEHISEINKDFIDTKIRFKGYTLEKYSRVYKIASCESDINLFKDSIPNKNYLDSLEQVYIIKEANKIKIEYLNKNLKRHIFAPFNRKIYTMHVFNAIEYDNFYYVEIYLVNRGMATWSIGVKFDKESLDPVNQCYSYLIY